MNKVAVVTDSNSGITQQQAKDLGIHVIPMPFTINGKDYFEDIDLTQQEFYEKLNDDADIGTSQPAAGTVLDLWEELLKDYDEIVHIPMSSGLSGSCETALALAADYDGKVQVVNNHRISVTQRQSALDALKMAEAGMSAAQIRQRLEDTKMESSIYIMVDTLKYLKKGGRITPAAAAIGTILNLKPVLQINGEKLDAFSKARGIKQGKRIMMDAIQKDLENKYTGYYKDNKIWLYIAYTYDKEAAEELAAELKETYPGLPVHTDPLSLSVACHIGPGALAIACQRMLEENETVG